jgi:hypothetical protein
LRCRLQAQLASFQEQAERDLDELKKRQEEVNHLICSTPCDFVIFFFFLSLFLSLIQKQAARKLVMTSLLLYFTYERVTYERVCCQEMVDDDHVTLRRGD